MTTTNHEVHLKKRPVGMPTVDDFEIVKTSVPDPGDGEFVVRNIWMTVDPYMRGRMTDRKSYVPPFQVGQVLDGGSVGQVVKSRNSAFQEGDYVCGFASGGWREYNRTAGAMFNKVDPSLAPLQCFLGVLGMPGLTAYSSLLRIGEPKEGETIFVSAAAGAVGSVVSQIAKIKGLRVVGSAGSEEKCRWVTSVAGADECVNYRKAAPLLAAVSAACPKGIDIYYENVGGEHLEVALELMNSRGRLVMCGMISMYNATEAPAGPRNLVNIIGRSLRMQGFIVSDYVDMVPQFYADMGDWIRAGKLRWQETVLEGISEAPNAFIGLFRGDNAGKMLVRLGPDRI